MPAFTSSAGVVNAALELIASQAQISSLTDGSPQANAANVIYVPVVQLMLRELDPDFARFTASLSVAVTPSQVPPWAYEYVYPSDCVRLRGVRPPASGTGSLSDVNNPQPIRAQVAFDTIASTPKKVILTNQQNALAVYTTSQVTETMWDAAFGEAVVRRLASPLAMALAGRPDFAQAILESASRVAQTCEAIDDSGFRRPS